MDRGDSSQVFQDVLLAYESDWHYPASRERERGAKAIFKQKDALAVMPEGPMPEVRHVLLAGVKKLVVLQVLVDLVDQVDHQVQVDLQDLQAQMEHQVHLELMVLQVLQAQAE